MYDVTNFSSEIILVSQQLHSCTDFAAFYKILEKLLAEYAHSTAFSVVIFNSVENDFSVDFSNYFPEEFIAHVHLGDDNSVVYDCFSSAKSWYSGDPEHFTTVIVDGKNVPINGCEPLLYRDQMYGLLLSHQSDTLINAAWMRLLASFTSAALINIQLYEQTNLEASGNATKLWAIKSAGELLSHLELDSLVVKIMELVLSIVSAQVGSIMIEESNTLVTKVEWGLTDEVIKSIVHISDIPLVEYVKQQREPFLIENLIEDERVKIVNKSVQMDSLLVFPLHTKDRVVGVVNIVNSGDDGKFSNRDMELLVTITNLLSISIENALLYKEALEQERMQEQLNIARKIQQDLMPIESPLLNGYEIFGINLTCDETGGDYFDYFSSNPEKFLQIVIGDVSGHGIGSALIMASARAHIRAFANHIADIKRAMSIINNLLIVDMERSNQFMTLKLMTLDFESNTIRYISAGHEIGLIYRPAEDIIIELESTGVPLGLLENVDYAERCFELQEKDVLLLYTDGIKEAMNFDEEMFGLARIKDALKQYSSLPAEEIQARIIQDVNDFTNNADQTDDWTIIVLKVDKQSAKPKDNEPTELIDVENIEDLASVSIKVETSQPEIAGEQCFHEVIMNDLDEKELLLDRIIDGTRQWVGISEEDAFSLRLCLDEAYTNCYRHGNKHDPNKHITTSVYNNESALTFVISDEGDGFDPTMLNNVVEPAPWFHEGGRGVFLMKELMDDLLYFNNGKSILMGKKYNMKKSSNEEVIMITSNPNCLIQEVNGVYKISFKNNKILNETNIERIHSDIIALIDDKDGVKVIIDFTNVKYLSSSVLSKLVAVHKKAVALNGKLCLCQIDPVIRKIFDITKLSKLFNIFDDFDKAIASF